MVKKTRCIAWLLIIIFLVFSVPPALASAPSAGLKIWPAKTTTEVNKVWTIDFNQPLLSTSINSNTIYVTDSKQKKVPTTAKLSTDTLSVTVTPSKAYEDGDYNLYITNEVTAVTNVKHNETIIIPFTVQVPFRGMSSASMVVTVTMDTKAPVGDLTGSLHLENPQGALLAPFEKDEGKGKYTFNIYDDGDYKLKYYSVDDSISMFTTRTVKLPAIKLPVPKADSLTPVTTTKTASLTIASKAGVEARKSGAIGGRISLEQYGVPITVSNSTTTWTTKTDIDGNFVLYLSTGTYQLDIDGVGDQYKKHSYKLSVAAGQMASPQEIVDVKEPIGTLGLDLDAPLRDGAGILYGITAGTKQISGMVDDDTLVEVYDIALEVPKRIVSVKPKNGKFVAKLPSALSGKKLQIRVSDPAGNVYAVSMGSVV